MNLLSLLTFEIITETKQHNHIQYFIILLIIILNLFIYLFIVIKRFDILVNGGGSVTLNFQRHPFKTRQATVMLPWNRMITMDTVTLTLETEADAVPELCPSVNHDIFSVRPVVTTTWQHSQLAACASRSTVILESQVR